MELKLRGRDLVSWVAEARQGTEGGSASGWLHDELGWAVRNFAREKDRLGMVVPLALGIILAMPGFIALAGVAVATVAIFGIFGCTALMLLVFPGVLSWAFRMPAKERSGENSAVRDAVTHPA